MAGMAFRYYKFCAAIAHLWREISNRVKCFLESRFYYYFSLRSITSLSRHIHLLRSSLVDRRFFLIPCSTQPHTITTQKNNLKFYALTYFTCWSRPSGSAYTRKFIEWWRGWYFGGAAKQCRARLANQFFVDCAHSTHTAYPDSCRLFHAHFLRFLSCIIIVFRWILCAKERMAKKNKIQICDNRTEKLTDKLTAWARSCAWLNLMKCHSYAVRLSSATRKWLMWN